MEWVKKNNIDQNYGMTKPQCATIMDVEGALAI